MRSTLFSSLDVREATRDINKAAVHHRLNNFYDIGPKTFVMRFGAADSKHRVVFEPGVRMHMTEVDHEKPKLPSHFTLMIRKHIRGWRLFSCTQIGRDRVVDFAFGSGETPQFHMFVELWGQGNIVLCDAECKIMAFWRTPRKGDKDSSNNSTNNAAVKAIGDVYHDYSAAASTATTASAPATTTSASLLSGTWTDVSFTPAQILAMLQTLHKERPKDTVASVFPTALYGPSLIKHVSLTSGLDFTRVLPANANLEPLSQQIAKAFAEVDAAYSGTSAPGGFVFCAVQKAPKPAAVAAPANPESDVKKDEATTTTATTTTTTSAGETASATTTTKPPAQSQPNVVVVGFAKIPLKQYSNTHNFTATPVPTFSAAADAFYSAEERKRLEDLAKKQPTAQSREERCRAAIQRRITELENECAQRRRCANALLLASDEVDKTVQLISDALALGTPWKALTDAIRRQREAASEDRAKKKSKRNKNDDDDDQDDDGIDLGSSSEDDEEGEERQQRDAGSDLFLDDNGDSSDGDDASENSSDDEDFNSDGDEDDDRNAAARAADEQRYLLSLIYALDLRRNQMTLQLPDPEAMFDEAPPQRNAADGGDGDETATSNADFDEPTTSTILVVVDISLTAHENATKYFEAAKKADRSKAKTADREEDAVASAKKSQTRGSQQKAAKKAVASVPKQLVAAERTPQWFERYFWFVSSAGDLVVTPKDAGQADVLMTKFASMEDDAVVKHDEVGAWPTLVKSRSGAKKLLLSEAAAAAATSSTDKTEISLQSLREAGAACVCRSGGWQQKKAPKAYWCAASALSKTEPGSKGGAQLPQGQWFVPNEARTPLEVFSLQLCVALVEARSEEVAYPALEPQQRVAIHSKSALPSSAVATKPTVADDSGVKSGGGGAKQQQQQPKQQQPEPQPQQQQQLSDQAKKRQEKKAKLIQKKYGEQDEEDRAIALALIGTTKSKAHDLIEDDMMPATSSSASPKKDKKDKKDKKSKNDDDDGNDNAQMSSPTATNDASAAAASAAATTKAQQQNQQQQRNPRVGGGKAGGGALTEDAAKNLAEKITTAASEWLTMRIVGLGDSFAAGGAVRYVAPVCVPVLAIPTNKVRVLIVPGGEKRNQLAQEITKGFIQPLATHVQGAMPDLAAALGKIPTDDVLQALPMTAKVQTPFRASMVQLPENAAVAGGASASTTAKPATVAKNDDE